MLVVVAACARDGRARAGGYYYTRPEARRTYAATLRDVHSYAAREGIPYTYALLDSWWYYKGAGGGVKNWTARGDIYPHGADYVYNETGWPVVAHNRWWSGDTDYAKQNGGAWEFAVREFAV